MFFQEEIYLKLTEVSEQYLLNMERKAFVELCGERKTLKEFKVYCKQEKY